MKNNYRSLLSMSAIFGSLLLSSCIGDGPNKYSDTGVFTVSQEGANYIFFRDYGGAVRMNSGSIQDLLSSIKGNPYGYKLNSGERYVLMYSYEDDNMVDVPGKGLLIDKAEMNFFQIIPEYDVMTKAQAEAKNQLVADSVFALKPTQMTYSDIKFGAYRGFITAQFTGPFSIIKKDKGTTAVLPSLNVIMNPEENLQPNVLNLKLSYNRHTRKDSIETSSQTFCFSYPLSNVIGYIQGNDSVTINIEGSDMKSPVKLRIGREDLRPSDYVYFAK